MDQLANKSSQLYYVAKEYVLFYRTTKVNVRHDILPSFLSLSRLCGQFPIILERFVTSWKVHIHETLLSLCRFKWSRPMWRVRGEVWFMCVFCRLGSCSNVHTVSGERWAAGTTGWDIQEVIPGDKRELRQC